MHWWQSADFYPSVASDRRRLHLPLWALEAEWVASFAGMAPRDEFYLCGGGKQRADDGKPLVESLTERHHELFAATRGDTRRLQRALSASDGVTVAAIGSSNVVRGGCHAWQNTKCSLDPRYKGGWLLRFFAFLNQTWPHPNNVLVNHARMATGPEYFLPCVNRAVPDTADLVVIGFGEFCDLQNPLSNRPSSYALNTTNWFAAAIEGIIATLRRRADPPSILLWNIHKWTRPAGCIAAPYTSFARVLRRRGPPLCDYFQSCDQDLAAIASYHFVSSVSLRNAFYADAHCPSAPLHWSRWTIDGGGHLNSQGDALVGALTGRWLRDVSSRPSLAAAPLRQPLLAGPFADATQRPALCFSFDDTFVEVPHNFGVPHRYQAQAPQLARPSECFMESTQQSTHGALNKSGLVCTRRGACVVLNTTVRAPLRARLGFLASPRSRAEAEISCTAGCTCPLRRAISLQQGSSTLREVGFDASMTRRPSPMARPIGADLADSCLIQLCSLIDGERFKLISLTVELPAALDYHGTA